MMALAAQLLRFDKDLTLDVDASQINLDLPSEPPTTIVYDIITQTWCALWYEDIGGGDYECRRLKTEQPNAASVVIALRKFLKKKE